MRRREFIALLGGAAAWPVAVRAQQAGMPVVGYLTLAAPEGSANFIAAFREGLNETGYVEGRNVTVEYRLAGNAFDRLPEWAADMVRRRVSVIVAQGNAAAFAAKAATATIPIVFTTGGDPVQNGLVPRLNRPGGNITGVTNLVAELGTKRLGLVNELLPRAVRFALLVNPTSPNTEFLTREARIAAETIGRQIEIVTASSNNEIDTAFASLAQKRVDALLVNGNTLFNDRRVQLVTLSAHYRLPTIYSNRATARAGGLMSYGSGPSDENRQVGIYVGRILKGDKPADLPVIQPTKFEFVINLQTARTLGLDVPATLLARADEVIE